jgi:transcription factor-like protein
MPVAVEDEDLLNLLLAYSACHRAMLLKHDPPANRIANWVQHVFQKLITSATISLNIVATSIIFASLEIIAPSAFGVMTTWRQYLHSTRGMLEARASSRARYFEDRTFFLSRWFGYLDIIGSLSGPQSEAPTNFDLYWVEDPNEPDGVIDCFFGCTMLCMKLLGQVATLVKEAQYLRLDEKRRVRSKWAPSPIIKQKADRLLEELLESVSFGGRTCPHEVMSPGSVESQKLDLRELETTNTLYHWAGIIQLRRRVLNNAQDSYEVKEAVSFVLDNLDKIRAGSPAEACLLFPIFTAGCEAMDTDQRQRVKSRISDIEGFGMKQVCVCPFPNA